MNITKDQLLGSDWNTLFTRDPATFFEAVLINILWNGPGSISKDMQAQIEKQKFIFLKWHEYYGANLHRDIETELATEYQPKLAAAYKSGERAGKVNVLSNLPFKKGALGKTLDLNAVTAMLDQLKAEEPTKVATNGQNTN